MKVAVFSMKPYDEEFLREAGERYGHELEFFGSSVSWFALQDAGSGIAEVFVDGALAASVDLYSATPLDTAVFKTTFGAADWHSIRIEVTGLQSAVSAGAVIKTNGFAYSF